jgi:hypothetical protein
LRICHRKPAHFKGKAYRFRRIARFQTGETLAEQRLVLESDEGTAALRGMLDVSLGSVPAV